MKGIVHRSSLLNLFAIDQVLKGQKLKNIFVLVIIEVITKGAVGGRAIRPCRYCSKQILNWANHRPGVFTLMRERTK